MAVSPVGRRFFLLVVGIVAGLEAMTQGVLAGIHGVFIDMVGWFAAGLAMVAGVVTLETYKAFQEE